MTGRGRRANPWDAIRPGYENEVGRAVIHVAIEAQLLKRSFTQRQLVDLVHRLSSGSIVQQVGVTKGWGRENSVQVAIVNGGPWIERWSAFKARARGVASDLAKALGQEMVILETWSKAFGYSCDTYTNRRVIKQARRARSRARRGLAPAENPPREWLCYPSRPRLIPGLGIVGGLRITAKTAEAAARKAARTLGEGPFCVEPAPRARRGSR